MQLAIQSDSGAEIEPNDALLQATDFFGTDVFVFGGHQVVADSDYYEITVPAGASIRAEIIEGAAETCESNGIDSNLELINASGLQLVSDDDDGRGYCSQIDGTGAAGFKDAGA